jgi:hypothetical protein
MVERRIGTPVEDPSAVRSRVVHELVFRALTVNGSVYELDISNSICRRIVKRDESGERSVEGGETVMIGPVQVGRALSVLFLPFEGGPARHLVTSPVISLSVVLRSEKENSN